MTKTLRPLFACCAAGALAVSLAACSDNPQQSASTQMALADGLTPGWTMMDLAGVDPQVYGDDGALPEALPLLASYEEGTSGGYAPMFDYAPDNGGTYYEPLDESYYYGDDGYDQAYFDDGYDDQWADDQPYDAGFSQGGLLGLGGDASGYALLAVVAALTGMLGDAPPDYGFSYDGLSPWAWQTSDRYYRYAEPVHGGYRYYYYEPDAYRPFFVSDPYYSYGYRNDRIVGIYDRNGRRLDQRRARLQIEAGREYYGRAERLHRAAQRDRHGVAAPLWARQREFIARDRQDWITKTASRPAVRQWEARNAPRLERQWAGEALVRRDAERRFNAWQRADFKTPPPKLYTPQARQEQVRRVAELRQERAQEVTQQRRETVEKRREVRQEAQRLAQRAERRDQTRGIGRANGVERVDRPEPRTTLPTARERIERGRPEQARPDQARPDQARPDQAQTVQPTSRQDRANQVRQQNAERGAERATARDAAKPNAPVAVQPDLRKPADRQSVTQRSGPDRKAEQGQRETAAQRVERNRAERAASVAERPKADKPEAGAAQQQARQAAERRAAQQAERQQAAQRQQAEQRQQVQRERVQREQTQREARQQTEQRQQEQAARRQQVQERAAQRSQERQVERQQPREQRQQPAQVPQARAEQRQPQVQQARTEQRQEARQQRQEAREQRDARREERREAGASRRSNRE